MELANQRYAISNQNLFKTFEFCDDVIIYDNSKTKPMGILHIANNEISLLSDNLPNWCNQLLIQLLKKEFRLISD